MHNSTVLLRLQNYNRIMLFFMYLLDTIISIVYIIGIKGHRYHDQGSQIPLISELLNQGKNVIFGAS